MKSPLLLVLLAAPLVMAQLPSKPAPQFSPNDPATRQAEVARHAPIEPIALMLAQAAQVQAPVTYPATFYYAMTPTDWASLSAIKGKEASTHMTDANDGAMTLGDQAVTVVFHPHPDDTVTNPDGTPANGTLEIDVASAGTTLRPLVYSDAWTYLTGQIQATLHPPAKPA